MAGTTNESKGTSSARPSGSAAREGTTARQRANTSSTSSSSSSKPSSAAGSGYTVEQVELVKIVCGKSTTDFYGILEIPRSAGTADVKKAYRRLALLLHPDKNQAPNSEEAFKRVSRAFSVLSDANKRSIYDSSGVDPDAGPGRGASAGNPGGPGGHPLFNATQFDTDFNPEDIFRHFFGGGNGAGPDMPPPFGLFFNNAGFDDSAFIFENVFAAHPTGRRRLPIRFRQQQQFHREGPPRTERQHMIATLVHLLTPLFLIAAVWIISMWTRGPAHPRFSFTPSGPLQHEMKTPGLGVRYFVHHAAWDEFATKHNRHIKSAHANIEGKWIELLDMRCNNERILREHRIQRAIGWGWLPPDTEALESAKSITMPSCDTLAALINKLRDA